MAKSDPTRYLSHVPMSIRDGGLVAFVVLASKNENITHRREPGETRTLYYVNGENKEELFHSKKVLEHALQKTTHVLAIYDQVDFKKGRQVFDAIVRDYNDSSNYVQSRFNFEHRIIDYARHFQSKQP